jgi:poly(3-hydroxybutyrate) depolymerase
MYVIMSAANILTFKGTWQGVPNWPVDDILFTNKLLDHLLATYNIDSKRVYATGKSQGGGFVGLLACHSNTSRRIAAFAPVSGAFYTTASNKENECEPDTVKITCNPTRRPISFIEFHGGKDDTIDYNGGSRRGVCLPSIPHYLRAWALRNGFKSQSQTSGLSQNAVVHSYANGTIKGYFDSIIGHDWPSTIANADNSRKGHVLASFNATSIILDFFDKITL